MIESITVQSPKLNVDADVEELAEKKIGRLDRFIPRAKREATKAEVIIKETNKKGDKKYLFEAVLDVPGEKIVHKEYAAEPIAAVNMAEKKLKVQLKKYKETHSSLRLHNKVLARLRRRSR